MAKPEWGQKRVCLSCSAKFYDLQRSPITCPMCGTTFEPEQFIRLKRSRSAQEAVKKAKPEAEDEELEDSKEDEIEDDDDDDVIEDTDDLSDDDDIDDVVDGAGDGADEKET